MTRFLIIVGLVLKRIRYFFRQKITLEWAFSAQRKKSTGKKLLQKESDWGQLKILPIQMGNSSLGWDNFKRVLWKINSTHFYRLAETTHKTWCRYDEISNCSTLSLRETFIRFTFRQSCTDTMICTAHFVTLQVQGER